MRVRARVRAKARLGLEAATACPGVRYSHLPSIVGDVVVALRSLPVLLALRSLPVQRGGLVRGGIVGGDHPVGRKAHQARERVRGHAKGQLEGRLGRRTQAFLGALAPPGVAVEVALGGLRVHGRADADGAGVRIQCCPADGLRPRHPAGGGAHEGQHFCWAAKCRTQLFLEGIRPTSGPASRGAALLRVAPSFVPGTAAPAHTNPVHTRSVTTATSSVARACGLTRARVPVRRPTMQALHVDAFEVDSPNVKYRCSSHTGPASHASRVVVVHTLTQPRLRAQRGLHRVDVSVRDDRRADAQRQGGAPTPPTPDRERTHTARRRWQARQSSTRLSG